MKEGLVCMRPIERKLLSNEAFNQVGAEEVNDRDEQKYPDYRIRKPSRDLDNANCIWVAKDGDDADPGTEALPVKTLFHACELSAGGGTPYKAIAFKDDERYIIGDDCIELFTDPNYSIIFQSGINGPAKLTLKNNSKDGPTYTHETQEYFVHGC